MLCSPSNVHTYFKTSFAMTFEDNVPFSSKSCERMSKKIEWESVWECWVQGSLLFKPHAASASHNQGGGISHRNIMVFEARSIKNNTSLMAAIYLNDYLIDIWHIFCVSCVLIIFMRDTYHHCFVVFLEFSLQLSYRRISFLILFLEICLHSGK